MPDREVRDNGTQRRDGRDGGGNIRDFKPMTAKEKDKVAKSTGGLLGRSMRAARKRKKALDAT